MTVSTFAIGALAIPIFELGFVDTALTIIFVNILGIMPVCFFSTFGPKFGLRQMPLSRFLYVTSQAVSDRGVTNHRSLTKLWLLRSQSHRCL